MINDYTSIKLKMQGGRIKYSYINPLKINTIYLRKF